MAKIYNITCGSSCGSPLPSSGILRCPSKYDARCVIYKGDKLYCINADTGEDLETILLKFCSVIDGINNQITLLDNKIDSLRIELENRIQGVINDINALIATVNLSIYNLNIRVTNTDSRIDELIDNFCNYVTPCIEAAIAPIWTLVPELSGCSTSQFSYIPFNSEVATSNGYYVETYRDTNIYSKTEGALDVRRVPARDGECVGESENWVPQGGNVCSNVDMPYQTVADFSMSETPGENIYGYRLEQDINPNSVTYNEERYARYTYGDNECNPPALPDPIGLCSQALDFYVTTRAGATAVSGDYDLTAMPAPFTFDAETKLIQYPNISETQLPTSVDISVHVTINNPLGLEWEIGRGMLGVITGTDLNYEDDVVVRTSITQYLKYFKTTGGEIVQRWTCL